MRDRIGYHPPQVQAGRERKLAGERILEPAHAVRPYFCRTCGKEAYGTRYPVGWYSLNRQEPDATPPARLGLYCSVECLERQLPRLRGIHHDLQDREPRRWGFAQEYTDRRG